MGGIARVVTAALVALAFALVAPDVPGTWEIEANFDDASMSGGGFDC